MIKKSFLIFIYLFFLSVSYSNSLKPQNSENKFPKFNQNNFKNEEEKPTNYQNPQNEDKSSEAVSQTSKTVYIKIEEIHFTEKILVGEKGIIYLTTNYNDNKANIFNTSDIEEKTKFETIIYDNLRSNIVYCRLWKPNNENLRVICKYNNFDLTESIRMEKVSFNYNEYTINISPNSYFYFDKKYYVIPFLYSDKQIIEIKDNIETYDLKFKIEEYNNELLYLYGELNNSLILDNCQNNENELNCKVTKEKLQGILIKNNEQFRFSALNDNEGLTNFTGVFNITINHNIKEKENIFIGINGTLTDYPEVGVPFGFKTNVTNIPNIISNINNNCYFKKFNDNPLLYLCRIDETFEQPFEFGNLTNELVFNNLHYKYNFRIQPFEEKYSLNLINFNYKTFIKLITPEILNFSSEDTLTMRFITPSSYHSGNIKLNPNSSSIITCKDLQEMSICNVPVSHFLKEKNGNFNLYYSDNKRYYDIPQIKVILPNSLVEIPIEEDDNKDNIYIGDKGLLYLRTNFTDNETNIFDSSDIEEKTTFETTLNINLLSTNIKCRLWKPLNDKLWVFCKLNESLVSESVSINNVNFHYKEHTIFMIFKSSFRISTLNFPVPFLYSNEQIININEEKDSYDLKFHIGLYNEQPLCLSLDEMKKIILQDCKENGKDLICNIKKEKFYEIFSNNTSQRLQLYPYNASEANIEFKAVYDIIINFDSIQKEDIFIEIKKLLANNVNYNTYTAYETHLSNISDIISDSFELTFTKSLDVQTDEKFTCRLKKSIQTPLLIICLMSKSDTYYLKEIKEEVILENINVKYNFRIQPSNIPDLCEVK